MSTQLETLGSAHENGSDTSDWYKMKSEEVTGAFGSPIVAMESWFDSDEYRELSRGE